MHSEEKISLKLDEEVLIFIHNRLREFGLEHPDYKYEINYWVDDLVAKSVKEIYDYLAENECPNILKKGGDIIGKGRTTFYNLTKKEVL